MHDTLPQKLRELLRVWNVNASAADRAFTDIRRHYAEPGRFYHTLEHIENVLLAVDNLAGHAKDPNRVRLAAWLHDVIYDSRASDNEERSADYAEQLCAQVSIPVGRKVAALILTTKSHEGHGDPDAQVLIDADLAILGAGEAEYRTYAEQIRLEYGWVADADYRQGRCQVLSKFLKRPRIYHLLHDLEDAARRNIANEIGRLAGVHPF
jgi:predicted metal-dependent HD superfamily phosphohydrolase